MKNFAIVGCCALLAACASEQYTTDISTQSHSEEFVLADIPEPIGAGNVDEILIAEPSETIDVAVVSSEPEPQASKAPVKPAANQPRYGFTIQLVALGSQEKVDQFANQLPHNEQPIWGNYKEVNGTKWYTVLVGDYATRQEAAQALQQLPAELKKLKPFVKSIDSIKNSEYPTLNKLN